MKKLIFILILLYPVWVFAQPPTPMGASIDDSAGNGDTGVVWSADKTYDTIAAISALTNPMDSIGDIIYGGALGVATKLDAGATGKLLIAKGAAAPEWTPYTFPATVPTVGKVLISDGTNLIGSTALGTAAYVTLGADVAPALAINVGTAGAFLPNNAAGTNLTALNGENIQDDTIDDDSIDFSDVTAVDITMTDAGAITSSGTVTSSGTFDVTGAAQLVLGSADVLSHKLSGISEDLVFTPSADLWTIASTTGATLTFTPNTTITGDLTITGDDLYMTTNTTGFILVADDTNFNPVLMTGDATIAADGTVTVGADSHTHGSSTISGLDFGDDITNGAAIESIAGLTEADVSIIEATSDNAYAVVTSGGNNYMLGSKSDNSALEFKTPAAVLAAITADLDDIAGDDTDNNLIDQDLIEGFAASAAPAIVLSDSDASATGTGYIAVDAVTAGQDSIFQVKVDESDGEDEIYGEADGVAEEWQLFRPLVLSNEAATSGSVKFMEDSDNGTNFTLFQLTAQAGDITYTLPPDDGDAGEQLQTNGSGVLTWEAAGGAGATAWDDIGDPDADATIAFAGYEQTITSTLDEASHTVLTIYNTDDDRANATTILKLTDDATGDAQATYLDIVADADGTPASIFSINQSTGLSSTLNFATTGTILGAINIVVTTDGTEEPTAAQMYGTMFIADHGTATSDTDYTLPGAATGMAACFYDNGGGAGGVIIDAAAGDDILLSGATVGTADAIDSPGVAGDGANGDFICLMAIDANTWITLGSSGTWVDGGAD